MFNLCLLRRLAVRVIPLIAAIAVAVHWIALQLAEADRAHDRVIAKERSIAAREVIKGNVHGLIVALRGLSSKVRNQALADRPNFTSKFHRYTDNLHIFRTHPDVIALGWVDYMSADDRSRVLAEIASDPYRARTGYPRIAAPEDYPEVFAPVTLVTPRRLIPQVVGNDFRQNALLWDMATRAWAAGEPQISAPLTLLSEEPGVLLAAPAYDEDGRPLGIAVSAYSLASFLGRIEPTLTEVGVSVVVTDVTPGDQGEATRLRFEMADSDLPRWSTPDYVTTLEIGGRVWSIETKLIEGSLPPRTPTWFLYLSAVIVACLSIIVIAKGAWTEYGLSVEINRRAHEHESAIKVHRLSLESVSDGVFEWDIGSDVVSFSEKNWTALGYTRDQWPDEYKSWSGRVDPADLPRVEAAVAAHLEGGPHYDETYRIRDVDGNWRYWRSRGQAICGADGAPVRLIGTNSDVTALVAAQQQKRQLEAYQQALDEQAIVSVADRQGKITFANARFCDISGYRLDELLGKTHSIVNSGFHPRSYFVDMWRSIAKGKNWRGEICNRRKDGKFYWVDTTIVPVCGAGGEVESYVSIRFDISKSKELEAQLRENQENLEWRIQERTRKIEEQRLVLQEALLKEKEFSESQNQFVGMVSHEIRTPLTIIDGAAGALARRRLRMSDEKIDASLGQIRAAVQRLVGIMERTLTASRLESGTISLEKTAFDLPKLLEEVVRERAGISPEAKISLNIAPGFPSEFVGDPKLMHSILDNLLSNAIKYSPDAPRVEIEAGSDGSRLVVAVRDNGVGIPPKDLKRIGERFFRASTATGIAGTGIGLNLVKQIAELHGGALTVDSAVGVGSTFSLVFPATAERAEPRAAASLSA